MIDKPWRIQDEDVFIDRSLEYLAPIVAKFMDMEAEIEDKEKRKRIHNMLMSITEDRIMSAVTNADKIELIKDMLKIAVEDVKDWAEFSLNPESSFDDIMLRAILTEMFSMSFVCFMYISSNPNLTDDFIRDINYVNSGLFKFEEFDDEHVNAINAILETEGAVPFDIPEMRRLYNLKSKNDKLLSLPHNKVGSYLGINPPKLDYKALNNSKNLEGCLNKYKNLNKMQTSMYVNKEDEENNKVNIIF